jgi:hypothetical protein
MPIYQMIRNGMHALLGNLVPQGQHLDRCDPHDPPRHVHLSSRDAFRTSPCAGRRVGALHR